MILFVAIGFALYRFAGWENAFPVAVLAGLLLALLVPVKDAACSIKRPPAPAEPDES